MTVKEVLALAVEHLARNRYTYRLEELSDNAAMKGELASLLRAYNLVENELAVDVLPLKAEETLSAEDHLIPWSAFSYAPAGVRAVFVSGYETCFEPQKEGLFLPRLKAGKAVVRYCYSPRPRRSATRANSAAG